MDLGGPVKKFGLFAENMFKAGEKISNFIFLKLDWQQYTRRQKDKDLNLFFNPEN